MHPQDRTEPMIQFRRVALVAIGLATLFGHAATAEA